MTGEGTLNEAHLPVDVVFPSTSPQISSHLPAQSPPPGRFIAVDVGLLILLCALPGPTVFLLMGSLLVDSWDGAMLGHPALELAV